MADSPKPKPLSTGEEISVERRMLLAFALVGLVLVLSQFLSSPKAPQNTGAKQIKPTTAERAKAPAGEPPAPAKPTGTSKAVDTQPVAASSEQLTTVDTKVYRITFSNHGAVVRSWLLKDYKDSSGKPVELVNTQAAAKTDFPMALLFDAQKPATDPNQVFYAVTTTDSGLGLSFDFSDGRVVAHKAFRFAPDSYLFDAVSEV